MEPIYPISALQKESTQVREAAEHDIVRLTENGRGRYIFCTEEVFESYVARERENAIMEARIIGALDNAFAQIEAGQAIPAEESWVQIRARRAERAMDRAS